MKILVVEDDAITRELLKSLLAREGYEAECTGNGLEAWEILQGKDPPRLVLLDWKVPGMDGIELCRRIRSELAGDKLFHIIFLTAKESMEDILVAFDAGADDYISKPFHPAELKARLNVGKRLLELCDQLHERLMALEKAHEEIKRIHGLLPICSYCKRIWDDRDYWNEVEEYISDLSGARFSHSICPECYEKHIQPELHQLSSEAESRGTTAAAREAQDESSPSNYSNEPSTRDNSEEP